MVSKANKKKSEELVEQADEKIDEERFEDALADLNEAIKLNPKNDKAFTNRGFAKIKLKQYEDAITDLNEAIKLNPKNDAAYHNRGSAKNRLNQHENAIADYDESIRLNPEDGTTYNSRGLAKADLKDFEGAINDLEKSIELNPNDALYHGNLGAIRAEQRADEAIEERLDLYESEIPSLKEKEKIYRKEYRWNCWIRNTLIVILFLVILTAISLSSMPWLLSWLLSSLFCDASCDICICEQIKSIANNEDNSNFYGRHLLTFSITIGVTLPILLLIRIKARDAEDSKVMEHAYHRMHVVEDRIRLFLKKEKDSEKRAKLQAKVIRSWLRNSPVETLLRLRKRHVDDPASLPIQNLLERIEELLKRESK